MTQTDLALQSSIEGDVFFPGDDGYDGARRTWNLAADQRPAAVVLAESAADVAHAIGFALAQGLRIAPQGTGHGSMALESLEGAMLLKTLRMRRVDVDPTRHIARVEAGAEWEDVTLPAGEHGLAALAGTSPDVGVTGYTLGGGLGWLARRYGLAANSVTAVEIVTPDGRLTRADGDHDPDLFWAVRGGGGSVGVVTALEITCTRFVSCTQERCSSRSSAAQRSCTPGASGPTRCPTRSPPSAASCGCHPFRRSPCASLAGPS